MVNGKKNQQFNIIYSQRQINNLQKKINLLGKNAKFNAITFLHIQIFSSIVLFLVLLYISDWGYILAPVVTFIYYKLFYYLVIEYSINKRSDKLEEEAIHFFEVMILSLESGNSLKKSLEMACNNVDGDLSFEIGTALQEMHFGKNLKEVLTELKKRIPSENVNSILLSITQASIFGNDIIADVRSQINYLRDRQIQKIKGKMNKIPLKVSVISVLFYIPLIMLLILSPIIIEYLS